MPSTTKRTNFPCFSLYLASHLISKGFPLIDSLPNKKDPSRYVYYFSDSPELREEVKSYTLRYSSDRDGGR